jgi:hypothetical protein
VYRVRSAHDRLSRDPIQGVGRHGRSKQYLLRCSMTALTDTEVRWPPGLGRPDADAAVVYLDLLHWIGLAKAATGHRGGARYADVLAACRSARDAGVAIFPLSAVHYMEVSKIVRPDRRADIATIMEELSGFRTLVGRAQLLRIEREAALD